MLRKVRGNFIINNIFLNIKETKKFNLVRYNKMIQQSLNIKLIDYKRLSDRYTIFEENGCTKKI